MIVWLLALACAAPADVPAPSPAAAPAPLAAPAAPETTMRIQGPQDFPTVTARYFELLYGGGPPATLEVVLAPGVYEGAALSLTDGATPGNVSLRVRGEGEVVFRSTGLDLAGPEVEVSGVRFEGPRSGGYALQVVGERVTLSRVAFLDQALAAQTGPSRRAQGVLRIGARGPSSVVVVDDAWLVGEAAPLVFLEAQPGHRFERVTFRRSALAIGARAPGVQSMVLGTLRFEGCLLAAEPGAVPIVAPVSKGHVEIAESVVIADSVDAISVPHVMGATQPMEFSPLHVTGSSVHARAEEGDRDPGAEVDCEIDVGSPPEVDLADLAARARRGDPLDLSAWR